MLGPIAMDGFADGLFMTLAQTSETFTKYVGTDGKVMRSKTLDRSGTCTVELMQTSAANDLLSALHILDRDAPNGAGVLPLWIRDRNGRALYTAAQAWIEKAPEVTFDRAGTTRTWVIGFAKIERVDGGS